MMNFVTIFPETENVHLIKDVGMIPYIMYQKFGINSTIVCYKNGEYPYLNNEVKGLKIDFIKKYTGKSILDGVIYLFKNSRKIDILHLFHFSKRTALWIYVYKFLNKKGKVYLKLDADYRIKNSTNPCSNGIKAKLKRLIFNKLDLLSIETLNIYNYLRNNWKVNVKYIPNGFYDYENRELIKYDEKENIICTVGRIGTYEKATEVLLEGFKLAESKIENWKLKIVGPIENDFRNYIKKFYKENPQLKEKITFTGPIYDRNKLNEEYRKSKIFCLTSRYESFGLVFLEAMKNGCYIISSNVEAARDITDSETYGSIFAIDNADELGNYLVKNCNNVNKLNKNCYAVQEYAYNKFYWPNICNKILKQLNEK
ncbi:glycosyltransferase involved in cell wall biosynthesis [Clostridium algifaecis]|uniref:Glycosyltransferase involved in cell wall biosynthesis n=1 Tax=Clostridium algifaecis TaxID=1472040 RepID=A0ABS4KQ97_9CLOT|nr:glycosyltransferase [Clostridium algifaecis]MBP2032212.1 glycosyltransferase involved in cell wall biosynthesis [Clostridium algifaecis]